jgi:hypothetical protein
VIARDEVERHVGGHEEVAAKDGHRPPALAGVLRQRGLRILAQLGEDRVEIEGGAAA